MKKIIYLLLAASLALTACNKDFIVYEDIPAVYCFSNSGIVPITATTGSVDLPVNRGGYPSGVTSASIEVSTTLLVTLNSTSTKQYDLMPPACYSIVTDSVTLDVKETMGVFVVSFNEEVLKSLAKGNYALPLRLKTSEDVSKGKDAVYLTFQKL